MMFAGLYARLIRNWYVCPDVRLVVAMLKIHCWLDASHRNAASGISPLVVSFTASTVPRTALNMVNVPPVPAKTAAELEMAAPDAPHTRNFTGRSEERRVGKECRSRWQEYKERKQAPQSAQGKHSV